MKSYACVNPKNLWWEIQRHESKFFCRKNIFVGETLWKVDMKSGHAFWTHIRKRTQNFNINSEYRYQPTQIRGSYQQWLLRFFFLISVNMYPFQKLNRSLHCSKFAFKIDILYVNNLLNLELDKFNQSTVLNWFKNHN